MRVANTTFAPGAKDTISPPAPSRTQKCFGGGSTLRRTPQPACQSRYTPLKAPYRRPALLRQVCGRCCFRLRRIHRPNGRKSQNREHLTPTAPEGAMLLERQSRNADVCRPLRPAVRHPVGSKLAGIYALRAQTRLGLANIITPFGPTMGHCALYDSLCARTHTDRPPWCAIFRNIGHGRLLPLPAGHSAPHCVKRRYLPC